MTAAELVERILDDEGLTDGLDEPEATALVKRLVARAEAAATATPATAEAEVGKLRRLGRDIARVVTACRDDSPATAAEAARKAKLPWPPPAARSPADVLAWLLDHAAG